MKLIHNSQTKNGLDGNCAVEEQPFGTVASCGMDLSKALDFEPDYDSAMEPQNQPSVEFGEPLQDWFEMALNAETPVRAPAKNSWGEDEEEGEDEYCRYRKEQIFQEIDFMKRKCKITCTLG